MTVCGATQAQSFRAERSHFGLTAARYRSFCWLAPARMSSMSFFGKKWLETHRLRAQEFRHARFRTMSSMSSAL